MNKKAIFLLVTFCIILIISCSIKSEKGDPKDFKNYVPVMAKTETISLAISGMTC